MAGRRFPVLAWSRRNDPSCPASVPWELVAPHEKQALRNHDQTLERLAERGGLSPAEMWMVVHDREWQMTRADVTHAAAVAWLATVDPVDTDPAKGAS